MQAFLRDEFAMTHLVCSQFPDCSLREIAYIKGMVPVDNGGKHGAKFRR